MDIDYNDTLVRLTLHDSATKAIPKDYGTYTSNLISDTNLRPQRPFVATNGYYFIQMSDNGTLYYKGVTGAINTTVYITMQWARRIPQ